MMKNKSAAPPTPTPTEPDAELLAILVCPLCKGELRYDAPARRLVCRAEGLAFPITEDGIPALLADAATPIAGDD